MAREILECVECDSKFSEEDVKRYRFFPATRVCYDCYMTMAKAPFVKSCFGKYSKSKKKLGYNSLAVECQQLCPDRKVCPHFASGLIQHLHDEVNNRADKALQVIDAPEQHALTNGNGRRFPFRPGSATHEAFLLCLQGTTLPELEKWAAKHKVKAKRLLRIFRRGEAYGKTWDWHEGEGKVRIEFSK